MPIQTHGRVKNGRHILPRNNGQLRNLNNPPCNKNEKCDKDFCCGKSIQPIKIRPVSSKSRLLSFKHKRGRKRASALGGVGSRSAMIKRAISRRVQYKNQMPPGYVPSSQKPNNNMVNQHWPTQNAICKDLSTHGGCACCVTNIITRNKSGCCKCRSSSPVTDDSPTLTVFAFDASGEYSIPNNSRTNDPFIIILLEGNKSLKNFTFEENIYPYLNDNTGYCCGEEVIDEKGRPNYVFGIFPLVADEPLILDIPIGSFEDLMGNKNKKAVKYTWTYDGEAPIITIAADYWSFDSKTDEWFLQDIPNNSTTNDAAIFILATIDESTQELIPDDFKFTNGDGLEYYYYTDLDLYEVLFRPFGDGPCTVEIPANTIKDDAGNGNIRSNVYTWTYDGENPSITITSTDIVDETAKTFPIKLTFTANESIVNFIDNSLLINITNGELRDFIGDNNIYTGDFYPINNGPCSIYIPANTCEDLAGNLNLQSNELKFSYINSGIGINITAKDSQGNPLSSGEITTDTYIDLQFEMTEKTTTFFENIISIENAYFENFVPVSETKYTVRIRPTKENENISIWVEADKFVDIFNNENLVSNVFSWVYTVIQPPTMSIISNVINGTITSDTTINLTFESSEDTTDFEEGDISLSGGTLSGFSGSGKEYTAIFTPAGNGPYTIVVPKDKFENKEKLLNLSSNTFTWTYNDKIRPTMTITSEDVSDGKATDKTSINLTFTSSIDTTDFKKTDISFSGGSLSDLSGSGQVYTAVLTYETENSYTISVEADKFVDIYNNPNVTSNKFTWSYDDSNVRPTMNITSTTVDNDKITGYKKINLTFTSSADTNNFTVSDINGVSSETLSEFNGSGSEYTVIFTPPDYGIYEIFVPADSFTDETIPGSDNLISNTFTWTYSDKIRPTMTIDSTTVIDGSKSSATAITLIFKSSEDTINFNADDISGNITDGTFSDFSGSGKEYTAIFTPSSSDYKAYTFTVPEDSFTDSNNNKNYESNTFTWEFEAPPDNAIITMIVQKTDEKGAVIKENEYINNNDVFITITAESSIDSLKMSDITSENGILSDFTKISDRVYTIIFTPSLVSSAWSPALLKTISSQNLKNDDRLTEIKNNIIATMTNSKISNHKKYTAQQLNNQDIFTLCEISIKSDVVIPNGNLPTAFKFYYNNTRPTIIIKSVDNQTIINKSIKVDIVCDRLTDDFPEVIQADNYKISEISGFDKKYTGDLSMVETTTNYSIIPVYISKNTFTDKAGNKNKKSNILNFTYDVRKPLMIITSPDINSGEVSNKKSINLKFSLKPPNEGEPIQQINGFTRDSIDAINCELSNFKSVNNQLYTADCKVINAKLITIDIKEDKFEDTIGNKNDKSVQFNWLYDGDAPEITISSESIENNGFTNKKEISFILESSSDIPNNTIKSSSFSTTNCNIDNITKINVKKYSFKVKVKSINTGSVKVKAKAAIFKDEADNSNLESNEISFIYDDVKPTIKDIQNANLPPGVLPSAATNIDPILFNIISNKIISGKIDKDNFEVIGAKITKINNVGSISWPVNISATDNSKKITLEVENTGSGDKKSIYVKINGISDRAGNKNDKISPIFTWYYDNDGPIVSISAKDAGGNKIEKGQTITNKKLTCFFDFSEDVSKTFNFSAIKGTDWKLDDTTVNQIQNTLKQYSIKIIATGPNLSFSYPKNICTDAAGNGNIASDEFTVNYDSGEVPTVKLLLYGPGDTPIDNTNTNNTTNIICKMQVTNIGDRNFNLTRNSAVDILMGLSGKKLIFTPNAALNTGDIPIDEEITLGELNINVSNTKLINELLINSDAFKSTIGDKKGNNQSGSVTWTYNSIASKIDLTAQDDGGNPLDSNHDNSGSSIDIFFTSSNNPDDWLTIASSRRTTEGIKIINGNTKEILIKDGLNTEDIQRWRLTVYPDNPATSDDVEIVMKAGAFTNSIGNTNQKSNTFIWKRLSTVFPTIDITTGKYQDTIVMVSKYKNLPTDDMQPFYTDDSTLPRTNYKYWPLDGGKNYLPINFILSEPSDDIVPNVFSQKTYDGSGQTTDDMSMHYMIQSIKKKTNTKYSGNLNIIPRTLSAADYKLKVDIPAYKFTGAISENTNQIPETFEFYIDIFPPTVTITAEDLSGNTIETGDKSNDPNGIKIFINFNKPVMPSLVANSILNFVGPRSDNNCNTGLRNWILKDEGAPLENFPTPQNAIEVDASGKEKSQQKGWQYSDEETNKFYIWPENVNDPQISYKKYWAILVPTESKKHTLTFPENQIIDMAGNYNTASNTFVYEFDNVSPSLTVSVKNGLGAIITDGSTTGDDELQFDFTSSESFHGGNPTIDSIVFTNGSNNTPDRQGIDNFFASQGKIVFTFKPNNNQSNSFYIKEGSFTDKIGNKNLQSPTFTWTWYPPPSPEIKITSKFINVYDKTNGTSGNTVTFDLSGGEGFGKDDIQLTLNGADVSNNLINFKWIDEFKQATVDINGLSSGQGGKWLLVVPQNQFGTVNKNLSSNVLTWTVSDMGPKVESISISRHPCNTERAVDDDSCITPIILNANATSPGSYAEVIITFNKDLDLNESKLCNNDDIRHNLGDIFTLMEGSVSQDLSANFIGKNFKKLDSKKIQINLYVKLGVWDYDKMTLRLKPEAYVDQYGNFGTNEFDYDTNDFVIDTTNTTVNISITDGSDNTIDTITKMNFETGLKIRLDMSQNEVTTAPHKDGSGNWELRFQNVKAAQPLYVAGGKIANTPNPSYEIELRGEEVESLVLGLTPNEYKFIIYTTNIAENMMTTEQSIKVNLNDIYHINKIEVDNNKYYGDGQIIITTGGMTEAEIKGMYVVFTANPLTGTGGSFKYDYDDETFTIETISVTEKKVIINLPNGIRYKICKFQTKESQFQPLLVSAGFTDFKIKAYQTDTGLNHPHNFLPWIVGFGVKILDKHEDTASKPVYTWKELAFAMRLQSLASGHQSRHRLDL